MKKLLQFRKMLKVNGLHEPLIIIKGDPCPKCGLDEWGNILFCMCPMTEEEKATVAPKGTY